MKWKHKKINRQKFNSKTICEYLQSIISQKATHEYAFGIVYTRDVDIGWSYEKHSKIHEFCANKKWKKKLEAWT